MRKLSLSLLLIVVLLPLAFEGLTRISESREKETCLLSARALEIRNAYLQAVKRGTLQLFASPISKENINPIQVEFIYKFDDSTQEIKMFSELKSPVPVPNQPGFEAHGISTVLSRDGHVLDSTVHVSPR